MIKERVGVAKVGKHYGLDARVGASELSFALVQMPDVPVVTGYYRYTDIWFEWYASYLPLRAALIISRHQALPDIEDRGPVKAILGTTYIFSGCIPP